MRAYILRVLALSLLASLCDFFLPDGKMRRFASPLLGLAVVAAILLPAASLLSPKVDADALLPVAENILDSDVYAKGVEEEYKRRITAEIEARGATAEEIILDDRFSVERVVLSGEVPSAAMLYITTKLEVPRNHVEIR